MPEKSYKSAIVIIPPDEVNKQIQPIRKEHDKAYQRWMPHINLIWPFHPDRGTVFTQEAHKLVKYLSSVKPFKVAFTKNSFGNFRHGSSTTIWLKPIVGLNMGRNQTPISPPSNVKQKANKSPGSKQDKIKTIISTPKPAIPVQPREVTPQVSVVKICQSVSLPPPIPAYIDVNITPSLDNLYSATWTPENTPKPSPDDPAVKSAGLDCLRFAVYSPENTHQEALGYGAIDNYPPGGGYYQQNIQITTPKPVLPPSFTQMQPEKVLFSSEDSSSEEETSDEEEEEDEQGEENEGSSEEEQLVPGETHPRVMKIQSMLQEIYPDFNDTSTKSPFGFQPHLTLGQERHRHMFMDTEQSKWRNVEFDIKQIYLISRKGDLDPFEIKQVIPLGADIS